MHASLVEIHGSALLLDFDGLPDLPPSPVVLRSECFGVERVNLASTFGEVSSGRRFVEPGVHQICHMFLWQI